MPKSPATTMLASELKSEWAYKVYLTVAGTRIAYDAALLRSVQPTESGEVYIYTSAGSYTVPADTIVNVTGEVA